MYNSNLSQIIKRKKIITTLAILTLLSLSVAPIVTASAATRKSLRLRGKGTACTPETDCMKAYISLKLTVNYRDEGTVGGEGTGAMYTIANPGSRAIPFRVLFKDLVWSFDRDTHVLSITSEAKSLELQGEITRTRNGFTGELTGSLGPIVLSFSTVLPVADASMN